jgi:hypothetical protein
MDTVASAHKNPCPMFTIGWTGEAAAASLTMDLIRNCRLVAFPNTALFCLRTRHLVADLRLSSPAGKDLDAQQKQTLLEQF